MNDYDELVACLHEQMRLKTLWEECEKDNKELEAENDRLRKLVEPKEWLGWDQVDSIYDEARLLRRERDDALAEVEKLRRDNDLLREALRNG